MDKVGLREKKRALLKVAMLDEMVRLLETKDIGQISIEELCSNINTTKVTFFKYFSHKEQLLDYFIMKWLYDRSFEITVGRFHGRAGLAQIFRTISSNAQPGKKIMIALINYYCKLTEKPPTISVSPYEYYLFNHEAFSHDVQPLCLFQLFSYYLEQIESIRPDKIDALNSQLFALLYGVPIQVHMMKLDDMFPFYEMGLDSILGSKSPTEA